MSSACNHFRKEQQNKSKEHRRKYIIKTRGNATKLETKTQNRNRQAKRRLFERNNKTDTQRELSYTHTANRLGIAGIKTVPPLNRQEWQIKEIREEVEVLLTEDYKGLGFTLLVLFSPGPCTALCFFRKPFSFNAWLWVLHWTLLPS